jgi:ABC-type spermidine/putrescine transport system permease subunit II
MRKGPGLFLKVSMILGFAFLYAPIIILIIYSFNESKLVTVWGGFSTKWYASLWQNQGLMDAARISAGVAMTASTVATVLGVMAGLTLARVPRFFGRTLFSGMVLAPLVMPDVIIGLSLLLSFIAISLDRGFLTIVIAHATFSMCTTLPLKIFSSVRLGVTPEINAIATILIGLVATGTVIYSLVLKRNEAQRIRAEAAMKG